MKKLVVFCFVMMASSHLWAGFNIGGVFDGMSANMTSPGHFQDQASGYYTGGGLSMRTRRGSFTPFTFTPPNIKGKCGRFDVFLGGFSALKGEEMVAMMKNIGSQAAAYGFQLALKTYAPQIENLISHLRDLGAELGQFSIGDCNTGMSLWEGILPKETAMYEAVCKDLEAQGGGSDYLGSRKRCSDAREAREKAAEIQKSTDESIVVDNFNLFKLAAKKAGVPKKLHDSMMSIVGTIIVAEGKKQRFESLVSDEETFNAYLKGSQNNAEQYECKGKGCLAIDRVNLRIKQKNSYQGQADKAIKDLRAGMRANKKFDPEQIEFISSWGEVLPLYNYISLEAATGTNILGAASELVATHMLLHYMRGVVSETQNYISQMEPEQINDGIFSEYQDQLANVVSDLEKRFSKFQKAAYEMERRAEKIENFARAKIR